MTLWSYTVEAVNDFVAEMKENPPHSWLDDPREPLFTFNWDGKLFGFYAMSLTYWSEILMVWYTFLFVHWDGFSMEE